MFKTSSGKFKSKISGKTGANGGKEGAKRMSKVRDYITYIKIDLNLML